MKHYIIGDTGGHGEQLRRGLSTIGVDVESRSIPEDVSIIHLGDLIHKGPESDILLSMVEQFQERNPGQWIQLMGNHEAQHIPEAVQFWRCDSCSVATDFTIQRMHQNGQLKIAHLLKDVEPVNLSLSKRDHTVPSSRDWIFSHAGISSDWLDAAHPNWENFEELVSDMNRLTPYEFSFAGERLGRTSIASPVWASAPTEVFPS